MNWSPRHPGTRPERSKAEASPHLARPRGFTLSHVAGAAAVACCLAISCIPLLTPPVHAFSRQTRAAGASVFQAKGCGHCHGADGLGTDRGPDLSGIGKRWKKDRIEQQVLNGGGGMPPFADALQPDEVKSLVDFLGAKRRNPRNPKSAAPPAAPKPSPSPSDDTGL